MQIRDVERGSADCKTSKCQNIRALRKKAVKAWEVDDFETFSATVNLEIIEYDDKCESLLSLVARKQPFKEKYLEKILEFAPDLDRQYHWDTETLVQRVFRKKNFKAFRMLCEAGADLSHQTSFGDTILHYAVENFDSDESGELLEYILAKPELAVNVCNNVGKTPIAIAVSLGHEKAVELFLKFAENLDVDTFKETNEESIRERILKNYGASLGGLLPKESWKPRPELTDYKYRLFYFLQTCNADNEPKSEDVFIETYQNALDCGIDDEQLLKCVDYNGFTLLQQTVEFSKVTAMKFVVSRGADVNFAPGNTKRPIYLAGFNETPDCYDYLLALDDINISQKSNEETLLHIIVRNAYLQTDDVSFKLWYSRLEKLLTTGQININSQDELNRTPLRLAVILEKEEMIFLLLNNGAHLHIRDKLDRTPLDGISQTTFNKYLNTNTRTNDHLPQSLNYAITFTYKFLCGSNPDEIQDVTTKFLQEMINTKQHEKLIAHPAIASLLFLKWKRIRWLYFFYLFLSISFSIFYTLFIFLADCGSNCGERNPRATAGKWLFIIYLITRCFFEFFDFYNTRWKYLKQPENYIQWAMIVSTLGCLFSDCPINHQNWSNCNAWFAFSVLFVWFEFFIVVGQHPDCSFFLDMFRKANLFLIKFISVHLALILAFVLSFLALFQNSKPETFESFQKSLIKTLAMLTGEFELGSIPWDASPIASHVLFLLFLFFVSIVLFNLLTGLAVSATRRIEDDPYLFSNKAQISIISFIEKAFFVNKLYKLPSLRKRFEYHDVDGEGSLFQCIDLIPIYRKIYPKLKTPKKDDFFYQLHSGWRNFSERIVQDAQEVLERSQKQNVDGDKIEISCQQLQEFKSVIEGLLPQLDKIDKIQRKIDTLTEQLNLLREDRKQN